MIGAACLYALAVATLLGLAALGVEQILAARGWPRRPVWIVALTGSLALPVAMLLVAAYAPTTPAVSTDVISTAPAMDDGSGQTTDPSTRLSDFAWPARSDLDGWFVGLWTTASGATLALYGLAWLRLHRVARHWRQVRIGDDSVLISEGVGPAVFGFFKPRVVLPQWVLDGPSATRSLVLAHEREHIASHDQLALLLALVLVFLAPWNLALWWQLKRLRFAIEVDCDARVLRDGADSTVYSETLLAVSQHRSRMPLGAIALTEPVSQLERRIRIMMTRTRRPSLLLMAACVALSSSLAGAAVVLDAPVARSTTDLRKPPPAADTGLGPRFEALLKERYPELLSEHVAGTPIVTVLFNEAGAVERTELDTFRDPPSTFSPTESDFRRVGVAPEEVAYVGVLAVSSPTNHAEILVAFTERKKLTEPFVSALLPDRRALDRAIVDQYFPESLRGGKSSTEGLWVLLDREGRVLRTGQESFDASSLPGMLEKRFAGIKTAEITVTPVDRLGETLQLHCVWLAAGSPLPGA